MMALSPRFAHRPSPNFGNRAPGSPVDMIVLHHTGMADADGALAWLCDRRSEVSSHYFVFEDGRIARLVEESQRAWHAGVSSWHGETDINSRSIGIEVAHPGEVSGLPYPDAQVDAVIALCRDILSRHAVPSERILGHADIAPLRKEDPGRQFPWARLHEAGVGHWVPPAPIVAGAAMKEGDRGPAVATRTMPRSPRSSAPSSATSGRSVLTASPIPRRQRRSTGSSVRFQAGPGYRR
jgi:N-acetylmuramoyl-L-alanine amidase